MVMVIVVWRMVYTVHCIELNWFGAAAANAGALVQ